MELEIEAVNEIGSQAWHAVKATRASSRREADSFDQICFREADSFDQIGFRFGPEVPFLSFLILVFIFYFNNI